MVAFKGDTEWFCLVLFLAYRIVSKDVTASNQLCIGVDEKRIIYFKCIEKFGFIAFNEDMPDTACAVFFRIKQVGGYAGWIM